MGLVPTRPANLDAYLQTVQIFKARTENWDWTTVQASERKSTTKKAPAKRDCRHGGSKEGGPASPKSREPRNRQTTHRERSTRLKISDQNIPDLPPAPTYPEVMETSID